MFPCVSCFFPFRPEVGITPSRQHTSALHELSARRRHALNTPQVRTSCVHASGHAHEAAVGRTVLTEGHHAVDHGRRSHGGPGSAPTTLPHSKILLVLDLCMSSLTRAPVPRGAPIAQAETLHTPRHSSSLFSTGTCMSKARQRELEHQTNRYTRARAGEPRRATNDACWFEGDALFHWHMHEQGPPARARAPDEPVYPSPRRRAPPGTTATNDACWCKGDGPDATCGHACRHLPTRRTPPQDLPTRLSASARHQLPPLYCD